MVTAESILSIDKNGMCEASKILDKQAISQLVEWLSLKDDKIRYQAFLLLQHRSSSFEDVYPYWDVFRSKLKNDNSYQRSIGLMLISENTKWDSAGRMDSCIDDYLSLLKDEKPITIRQCIQGLEKIVPYKRHLCEKIARSLMSIRLADIKATMRKLVLADILSVLLMIKDQYPSEEIHIYIKHVISNPELEKLVDKKILNALNDF